MKINSITSEISKDINFKGIKKETDVSGKSQYTFYLPNVPADRKIQIELVPLEKVSDEWQPIDNAQKMTLNFPKEGKLVLDTANPEFKRFLSHKAFGYRYNLYDKNSGTLKQTFIDPGMYTNSLSNDSSKPRYTIVLNDRPAIDRAGSMSLVMTDICNIAEFEPKKENSPYRSFLNYDVKINQTKNDEASLVRRTHVNKMGGNLAGIAEKAPQLKQEGTTGVVGTPFSKDTMSSHKYWTQNPMQVSPDIGTLNDFKRMQVELFKHGMNYYMDAALVNEGVTGVRFQHILKHGKQSPFYYSFTLGNLDEKPLGIGMLPIDKNINKNVGFKIVNPPTLNGYESHKPIYVQVFDARFAGSDQQTDYKNLITTYANKNTASKYEVTSFYHTTPPYFFEVKKEKLSEALAAASLSPDTKNFTVKDGHTVEDLEKFLNNLSENWNVQRQDKPDGSYNWDGNNDIPKVKFHLSANDKKNPEYLQNSLTKKDNYVEAGTFMARDTAMKAVAYWTEVTRQAHLEYLAEMLKNTTGTEASYKARIEKLYNEGLLPENIYEINPDGSKKLKITTEMISKALNNTHSSSVLNNIYAENETYDDSIKRVLMNSVFETFECSNELSAVLSSPYLNKIASNADELANPMQRLDYARQQESDKKLLSEYKNMYLAMDELFENDFKEVAKNILQSLDNKGIELEDKSENKLNTLGKYALPLIMPEIFKFALMKTFCPDAHAVIEDSTGEIIYKIKDTVIDKQTGKKTEIIRPVIAEDIVLRKKGYFTDLTPKGEADYALKQMQQTFFKLNSNDKDFTTLVDGLSKRFKGLTAANFIMAEMIADKTQAGLGMRIDASKDVAEWDSVRNENASPDDAWSDTCSFWNTLTGRMLKVNPHAVTYAEITDLENFSNYFKHKNNSQAGAKLIEKITSQADYCNFYSLTGQMCAGNPEEASGGRYGSLGNISQLHSTLVQGWNGYPGKFFDMPVDGINHSYTFMSNHDKPRIATMTALNMELFHSDFGKPNHIEIAKKVFGFAPEDELKDVKDISPKAIAVGDRFVDAFQNYFDAQKLNASDKEAILKSINEAIAFYASGQMSDTNRKAAFARNSSMSLFDMNVSDKDKENAKLKADSFGARPFDFTLSDVISRAKNNSPALKNFDTETLKDNVLKIILEPALDKYKSAYKMLMTLPGCPTDFIGDKLGLTGYETYAKNIFQQNRNFVPYNKLTEKGDNIYKTYYKETSTIANLRKLPELSALNDGTPVLLPKFNDNRAAILRYNDKGSTVITLYNNSGMRLKDQNNDKEINEYVRKGLKRDTDLVDHIQISPDRTLNGNKNDPKTGLDLDFPVGMVFKKLVINPNATNDKDKYTDDGKEYIIAREVGSNNLILRCKNQNEKIAITSEDFNVAIFYATNEILMKNPGMQYTSGGKYQPVQQSV